ncbi:hypothetical protein TNCV_1705671 [Trichonephila clavipes]|uniref:Uncharacterized protein n=1 Tax=Trichonephila clavipes TaxID=2585209 RepID=A0A8X6RF34_TRICX|nr:hypothetical protein TNCV_1705671 [Trichonephila clavipes]
MDLNHICFKFHNTCEGRKVRSEYLPFRTNASTLPITPKRSSTRDVGTSSYRYHTTTLENALSSAPLIQRLLKLSFELDRVFES